jgi:adenylate cyclase
MVYNDSKSTLMKKILTHWTIAFVTLFVVTYIGLKDPQVKEILRLKGFDLLLQSEERIQSQNIGIVTIDEKSIEKYGQWPWKRDVLADLIIKLREQGAGVIVIPILFSEEDRLGGDDALTSVLEYGIVIAQVGTNNINKNSVPRGVAKINNPLPFLFEWGGMLGPIELFGKNASGVGVSNTAPEIDGVTRRIPLLMKIGENIYPAMAIEVIRVAVGAPSYQVKSGDAGIIAMRVPGFDTIKTDANSRIWLRWNKDYETISASEEDFSKFEGKTVIIGMSAEGLAGIIATPIGERYGYELTASTLDTVLEGKNIERIDVSFLLELVASFVLGIILILITRFLPYWVIGIKLLSWYIAAVWLSHYFFTTHLMLVDVSWILVTITIVGFHSVFLRFILEFKLKQQIRKQFEHYLEPKMVKKLQQNPDLLKLGGETKELTFLFCDIRGFTPISEKYQTNPQGLTVVINKFLTPMTDIIMKNEGTIDKYMGDCIMAFWNAPIDTPKHKQLAVKSALEMIKKLKELNDSEGFGKGNKLNIGIGINSGKAVVGNMGSEQRFDYSVLGDAVNLASRLEGVSKNYDATLIVGEDTVKDISKLFSFRKLDDVQVKGKSNKVAIYTTEDYDTTSTKETKEDDTKTNKKQKKT